MTSTVIGSERERNARRVPGVGAAVAGVGSCVPAGVVRNDAIAARLGVDESWLARRTGTAVRHVARPEERLEDLAAGAARIALADASIDPGEIDAVLVGTTTSDEMSPHSAPLVAADIGATRAAAIDVSSACVGFLACMVTGTAMIESGRAHKVLVIGADILTRYLDPDDPQSAMLFGDGAGAVVLVATEGAWRVGPSLLGADGSGRDLIRLDRVERRIRMDGRAVYRRAVPLMADSALRLLAEAGLEVPEVELFVFHQANSRILAAVAERLGVPDSRLVDVVGRFANTSSASLPIALGVVVEEGRLHAGDRVLLAAFGAGLVWGGLVLTWGISPAQ